MAKRFKWIGMIVVVLMLFFVQSSTVYAKKKSDGDQTNNGNGNSNGNGNGNSDDDSSPNDPGVSGDHTVIRTESAMWVLPHGDTFIINGQEVNIIEDWETIEIISRTQRGNSHTYTVEIGGLGDDGECEGDGCFVSCGDGSGLDGCIPLDGNDDDDCNGNGNGNGCNGNGNAGGSGGGTNNDCGGAWVRPGNISATGQQKAPAHAVVVGQDPEATGATIEWTIRIEPTAVIYEDWQLIGHRHVACVEGDLDENGNGNIYDPGDAACPHGWHAVIEHIYGCVEEHEYFREGINDLNAEISLTQDSREWIQNELAAAYPGASLINPEWSYGISPNCTWIGDACFWNFTANIPVTDPGFYNIKLTGTTVGTNAYMPRGFDLNVGEFGVYMIDNTALTQ